METKPKYKRPALLDIYKLFLGLGILENILAGWYLFSIPSKTQNTFLAGFSLQRIGAGGALLLVIGVYFLVLYDAFKSQKFLKFLTSRIEIILNVDVYNILIRSSLIIIVVSSLASILSFLFPGFQRMVFFVPNTYLFSDLGTLAVVLIGWVFLISLKMLLLDLISGRKASLPVTIQTRLMVISWIVEIFVALYFVLWSWVERKLMLEILQGLGVNTLILSVWFSFWALLSRNEEGAKRIFHAFVCISIWLCVFIISLQFSQWFGKWNTPDGNYFNFLAFSFLHGKLFLINPPSTGDLIPYNGHWFVAYAPFPAVLMLPFIAIQGINAFNTTTFSLVLAAMAAVVIYLILTQLKQISWIKLSLPGNIWLTAFFSFGTVYWYLSLDSRGWMLSQVVAVLFCTLAFLFTLKQRPAWVVGICLAAAMLSRPNIFTLWPALAAITIQFNSKEGKTNWRYIFRWGLLSAIPLVLGVGLLLYYNFLRFGNPFDFKYAAVNGASWITQGAQKYGVFSTHFMLDNLYWMFLALPPLTTECAFFLTRGWGMSMFFTSPAILYLARKSKPNWWICGCWCSIVLSIILLSMYSNNGALQYGYRYMMDFMIPIIMLIAYNAGNQISSFLKALIIASIFVNYYGTLSWFRGPC